MKIRISLKSYHNGAHCLTNKFMVRETINKRKNAEAAVYED